MPTRNGDTVPYGVDNIVPTTAEAAWGARLIVTQDGSVDFLNDRQGCAGENRPGLLAVLNAEMPMGRLRAAIGDLLRSGKMLTREARDIVIHQSNELEIHANTNASAGYCYVTAWLRPPASIVTAEAASGYCVFGDGEPITHWTQKPPNTMKSGVCDQHAAARRAEPGMVVTPAQGPDSRSYHAGQPVRPSGGTE